MLNPTAAIQQSISISIKSFLMCCCVGNGAHKHILIQAFLDWKAADRKARQPFLFFPKRFRSSLSFFHAIWRYGAMWKQAQSSIYNSSTRHSTKTYKTLLQRYTCTYYIYNNISESLREKRKRGVQPYKCQKGE